MSFRQFYLDALQDSASPRLQAALFGLAETGEAVDAAIFLHHIDSPRSGMRVAAIFGLGRCAGSAHVELLATKLSDPHLRVAKAAQRFVRLYWGRGPNARIRRPARPRPI